MDPRRIMLLLRRWWPLLVVGTLLAAGAAYLVSKAQPRVYQATAILEVNPGIGTIGGGGDFNELQSASWVAAQDARLIDTASIAQTALTQLKGQLKEQMDAGTLLQNTTAQATPQQTLFTVSVRAHDPNDAALLANHMATVFAASETQANTAGSRSALAKIQQEINKYSADLAAAQRRYDQLERQSTPLSPLQQAQSAALARQIGADQGELSDLRTAQSSTLLRSLDVGLRVSVKQVATPPSDAVSPRTLVNTLIAAVLALLVLCGLALLLEVLDTRPRSASDVAGALDLPLLGTISAVPQGGFTLAALEDPTAPLTDEYRLLRANLGLAAGDRATSAAAAPGSTPGSTPSATPGSTPVLAVTGADPGDGTTTSAVNLAAVAARAGTRVILVDANLRRPALHTLLDLPNGAGLSTLLRDGADPAPLLQEYTLLPGLRVLTAGPAPAEAIDLLGSPRMAQALAALRASADLVVVDAGVADLPDAAILAGQADTALIVARLHGATGPALAAAVERLRRAGASLRGAAVTLFTAPARAGHALRQPAPTGLADVERPARPGLRPAK